MAGTQWRHSVIKGQVGMVTIMGSKVKATVTTLTRADIRLGLVNHIVPRSKIDRKPAKFSLIYISRKVLGQMNKSPT